MFRLKLTLISVIALALFLIMKPVASAQHGTPHDTSAANFTAEQVREEMGGKSKAVIIDVRSIQEYKYGHIPGAIHVPSPAIRMLNKRLPKDKSTLIILYARGDEFSTVDQAFNALFKMGYKNLRRFPGGMLEWLDNHYPVKKGTRP